ncbi:signal transduction histidine kinase [Schinkia azotoformans MEV2011]|uniref:histidine kinase n=1 Tax=Schinkia azotoformans MEV2011 TaxID=1348973 RepID=A0A072NJC5_SCHAZ|nr:HAMP domain-containing sensor histidine kinase [Schinkia azotoformans]KEF37566.1 signal transduction histidine kinase [Schinkia azotoformans MEV2011]MEC1695292.1 HAMP domain-containing sensor histidine kinase [Schinkia azotoformans]MEC1724684.1 HAMP domain-containing sensor histidine kinase [Schinkia azotoformans]MEC1778022.1 HAMP domain-containing sensor histidine kinase [Schinkia azotoformans]MED4330957.1 HAMP domain-containing sensor histidine kinase [Schinkia azotoformans]
MLRSLHSKLLFYFVILSILSIFLMSIAFRLSFEDCFSTYLDNRREDEITRFTNVIKDLYVMEGSLNKRNIANSGELQTLISYQAVSEGLFYEIRNKDGIKVIDSMNLIKDIMGITINFENKGSVIKDLGLNSETKSLFVNNEKIGTVTFYYKLGYKKGEFAFKERLNKHIIAAEMTMVLISLIVSFFFSKKLTTGLRYVSNKAKELRGNLNVRIPVKGLSEEIAAVAISINELAESLSYQEKLRKQYSSDMAHEFRTPISTLRSLIEAFQDGILQPTADKLEKCHSELMRLVRLVNEQEQLMVAENPKLKLQIEPISLYEEISNIQEIYAPGFQKKNIALEIKELPTNVKFLADRDRFNQIISNILMNCFKFTGENGQVMISANDTDDFIEIMVADNGVGISEEDLPYVFERFYRGDKSRVRQTGGSGLGLSIVKALVSAQEATITIESKEKVGTKIILRFPKYIEN